MDKKTQEQFKKKLLEEQKDLEKQLKDLGEVPDMGSDVENEEFDE